LSFSCGNLVPSLFKNSGVVTTIVQTAGGGACVVDSTFTADGTIFSFSGRSAMCSVKNGRYVDVDDGVVPDYVIKDPSAYYNRTALSTYLDSLQ